MQQKGQHQIMRGRNVMQVTKRRLAKSFEYWERVRRLIPAGTQCLSKGPDQYVKGVYPIYLKRSRGCRVFDVDGNEYIDYIMGLGSVVLGYGYPRVNEAIMEQLKDGTNFSLLHPLELEVAELLTKVIPCAEMVRFGKNGSDVTSIAVRVARANTGRDMVAFCGYHGWQDWYAVTTSRNKGIPGVIKELTIPFEYNKIGTLERIFEEHKDDVAAVIMEPVQLEAPRDNFLRKVRDIASENGALLIFDEIITGFRFALGGAQEYYGVTPDLAAFGKGVANGMPLSVLVGKGEFMKELEGDVFFSSTFGGETLSLAAALATIQEIQEKGAINHIWKEGEKLFEGFNKLAKEVGVNAECTGFPIRLRPVFRDAEGKESMEIKGLFMQETVKRGILSGHYDMRPCYSHRDEEVKKTLKAWEEALKVVKKAVDKDKVAEMMEGEMFKEVFRVRR